MNIYANHFLWYLEYNRDSKWQFSSSSRIRKQVNPQYKLKIFKLNKLYHLGILSIFFFFLFQPFLAMWLLCRSFSGSMHTYIHKYTHPCVSALSKYIHMFICYMTQCTIIWNFNLWLQQQKNYTRLVFS